MWLVSACQAAAMAESMEPAARADQQAVVALPEHVDGSNAAQIRERLLAAFDHGAAVVIADMSATAACDHAGLDALARAYQQAAVRRADLRLVATASAVRRLLAAQGLDRLVPVYSSVEAAVAAIKVKARNFARIGVPPAINHLPQIMVKRG